MTFREAQTLYSEPVNSRWVACHAALGRPPKTYEFTTWIQDCWRRFAHEYGKRDAGEMFLLLGEGKCHKVFDKWLRSEVDSEGV